MASYSKISDLDQLNLGNHTDSVFSKEKPQKTTSDRCLYQNLDIVGSGASLAEHHPNSVSYDDFNFITVN